MINLTASGNYTLEITQDGEPLALASSNLRHSGLPDNTPLRVWVLPRQVWGVGLATFGGVHEITVAEKLALAVVAYDVFGNPAAANEIKVSLESNTGPASPCEIQQVS